MSGRGETVLLGPSGEEGATSLLFKGGKSNIWANFLKKDQLGGGGSTGAGFPRN